MTKYLPLWLKIIFASNGQTTGCLPKLHQIFISVIRNNLISFLLFSLSLGIYKYAGQNLGQMKNSAKYSTPENAITTVIKGWFEEHNDADMSFIEKYRHSE